MSVLVTNVRCMVKLDVGAVARLLTGAARGRGYIRPMPSFTLAGVKHEYLTPDLNGDPGVVHSWEYGQWPRVESAIPLKSGGTVSVYGESMRWTAREVLVRWRDDEGHHHSAWIPTSNVRRLTPSEWDIIEYHQTPENLRSVRWSHRLPGFLPD